MTNFKAAMNFVRENGLFKGNLPGDALLQKLDFIASEAEKIYNPLPGDRTLIGWFVFGGLEKENGQKVNADGVCLIAPDPTDRRAVIGISEEVLRMDLPEYAISAVSLHELAHLTYENHDDQFVKRLMSLQHRYFMLKEGRKL